METGILFIWVLAGVLGGIIASSKNRNIVGWALGCFLLPILVIVLLCMDTGGNKKVCPQCAEKIKEEAKMCKHCGSEV